MLGVLENVEENRSQRGDKYWTLIISGRRYTAWDADLLNGIQPGDQVQFAFQQSGQYRKILELRKSSAQNLGRWFHFQEDRSRRIARMSCLRTAAQVLEGKRPRNMKRAEAALHIARLFEEYIFNEQETRDQVKKVKP